MIETPAPREHAGGVLGVSGALLLLVGGLLGLLVAGRGRTVDGAAEVQAVFGSAGVPYGLTLESTGVLLTGETVVRLTAPAGATAADPHAPVEIVLLFYPSSAALQRAFTPPPPSAGPGFAAGGPLSPPEDPSARLAAWEREPANDWHLTVERDEAAWSKWRAPYAIERALRKGGTWRECARVNLDQAPAEGKARHLLFAVLWPDGVHADPAILARILARVAMLEDEPTG
ncbi:MAG: hypothetical protein AB1726_13950 [Planctomycetota bacterium]